MSILGPLSPLLRAVQQSDAAELSNQLHKRAPTVKVRDAAESPAIAAAVAAQRPDIGTEKAERVSAPDDTENTFLETREHYNLKLAERRRQRPSEGEMPYDEVLELARMVRGELSTSPFSIANNDPQRLNGLVRDLAR